MRELLLRNTATFNYNPNLFIEELLKVMVDAFVIKEGMLVKWLRNDKPHLLENMRQEVEVNFIDLHKQSQEESKLMAR